MKMVNLDSIRYGEGRNLLILNDEEALAIRDLVESNVDTLTYLTSIDNDVKMIAERKDEGEKVARYRAKLALMKGILEKMNG